MPGAAQKKPVIEDVTDLAEEVTEEPKPPITKGLKLTAMEIEEAVSRLEPKKGPPPTPKEPEEIAITEAEEINVQESDVEPAYEVRGFYGLEVTATIEKKSKRKGNEQDPNEDAVITDPETGIFGVADGLGGGGKPGSGAQASRALERGLADEFKKKMEAAARASLGAVQKGFVEQQLRRAGSDAPEKRKQITEHVEKMLSVDARMGRKAVALIEALRAQNETVKKSGGKTTACIGFIHETKDGKHYAVAANIGDSGAFVRRANGAVEALTQEDSMANALLSSGAISQEELNEMKKNPDKKMEMTLPMDLVKALDPELHRQLAAKGKNGLRTEMSYAQLKVAMVRALGSDLFEPSIAYKELKKGDSLILMTDGLIDEAQAVAEKRRTELLARAGADKKKIDAVPSVDDLVLAVLGEWSNKKTSKERTDGIRTEADNVDSKDDDKAIVQATVTK